MEQSKDQLILRLFVIADKQMENSWPKNCPHRRGQSMTSWHCTYWRTACTTQNESGK